MYASLVVCVDCHTQVRLYIDRSTGLEYHLSSALYHHSKAHGNILTLRSDLNAFICMYIYIYSYNVLFHCYFCIENYSMQGKSV